MNLLTISSRQSRRQQQTKTTIKNALIELILENNTFEDITVSEITSRADLNRGTFYIHYKDKDELLENTFFDAIHGITQALSVPYKHVDKVELNGIVPSTIMIFEHIENNKNLFKALDLVAKAPSLHDRIEQVMWMLNKEVVHFEIESVSSEIEYDIFISYQINATIGVIKHWIRSNFKYSAQFMCEQLTTIYSHRIVAMIMKHKEQALT